MIAPTGSTIDLILQGGYDPRFVNETPRGTTPLKLAMENPDVDLLHSRGRLGQSVLLPMGPSSLRDLLATNAYDFEKPWGQRTFLARLIGWGLVTTGGSVHKRQRKALNPAFNVKHIRALYPVMWKQTDIFLDQMEAEIKSEGKIEIGFWAARLALDVIGRGALSHDFQSLTTVGDHPVAKAFHAVLEPEPFLVFLMLLSLVFPDSMVRWLPIKGNRVVNRETRNLRNSCEEMLDEKQARLSEKKKAAIEDQNTILSRIIGDSGLGRDEIVDQMLTIIGAGHETSASSISWATHLLTLPENIHYQKILRDEIRTVIKAQGGRHDFSSSEAELQAAFENSPYLNGICEETLRLCPPVPATLRESVRQTTLSGNVIPKGTFIFIFIWAINRNPKFWGEDAIKFRPERWIDTQPDGSLRANKNGGAESNYCEMTFLHGPRACIGRDYAKAELKCALAGLFGRFEVNRLEGDDGSKVEIEGAVTTKPRGGLHVKLTPVSGW